PPGRSAQPGQPRHTRSFVGACAPTRTRPHGSRTRRRRRSPVGSAPSAVLRLSRSLLVATLVTRLAQQLAVLLLGHPLAALLDHRAHGLPFVSLVVVVLRR